MKKYLVKLESEDIDSWNEFIVFVEADKNFYRLIEDLHEFARLGADKFNETRLFKCALPTNFSVYPADFLPDEIVDKITDEPFEVCEFPQVNEEEGPYVDRPDTSVFIEVSTFGKDFIELYCYGDHDRYYGTFYVKENLDEKN